MLNRYHVDASKLSSEERDNLYTQLEHACFLTNVDLQHPGCYEVFLEEEYPLESVINFPDSCVITPY